MTPNAQITIEELIAQLASDRWGERRQAEDALRREGAGAVAPLVEALASPLTEVRWGAAKVLGRVAEPAAAPALVRALEDGDGGVRWVAAQALVKIGDPAVAPVLRVLMTSHDSAWLQEGAHHVLQELATPTLTPVIRALEGRFATITVPVAASDALKALATPAV